MTWYSLTLRESNQNTCYRKESLRLEEVVSPTQSKVIHSSYVGVSDSVLVMHRTFVMSE